MRWTLHNGLSIGWICCSGALRVEADTSSSNTVPPVVADINHASDLIKKRCKCIIGASRVKLALEGGI